MHLLHVFYTTLNGVIRPKITYEATAGIPL
eukprot:Gb_29231 [translate_table: standard]